MSHFAGNSVVYYNSSLKELYRKNKTKISYSINLNNINFHHIKNRCITTNTTLARINLYFYRAEKTVKCLPLKYLYEETGLE